MTRPAHINWSRRLPVRYDADVAVIGGGIAGVGAACAAAKSGARVVLVERFAVTGGIMTTGGVVNFCGEMGGQGEVFDEIAEGLRAFGALGKRDRETAYGRETSFDHELLAVVLQETLLRRGVKLLLHTRFVDARVRRRRITECVVCGASGAEALRARVFIDCTGEAALARAAGFATVKGRPGDRLQLPMSMMFFVREMSGRVKPQVPRGWFERIRKADDLPMTGAVPNGPGVRAVKVKVPRPTSSRSRRRAWPRRRRCWVRPPASARRSPRNAGAVSAALTAARCGGSSSVAARGWTYRAYHACRDSSAASAALSPLPPGEGKGEGEFGRVSACPLTPSLSRRERGRMKGKDNVWPRS